MTPILRIPDFFAGNRREKRESRRRLTPQVRDLLVPAEVTTESVDETVEPPLRAFSRTISAVQDYKGQQLWK